MTTVALATVLDREDCLRLLAAQLIEHRIPVVAGELGMALDGVLTDPTRGAVLIAREHGAIVGVAYLSFVWTLEHGGLSSWLEELYVIPPRRGQGIGGRLLDQSLTLARARGCAAVDLEVEAEHARAETLYARAGFRRHTRARWVRLLR